MFNRALYEENQSYILEALKQQHASSKLYFDRHNYPLVVYHLSNLCKNREQQSDEFYAIAFLSMANALVANNNDYESISVYLECLTLPYFHSNTKLRFCIYMQLLHIALKKEDLFFIELYMHKLHKYHFAIDDDSELQLLYDYLNLSIEIYNNPELNSSQLRIINTMLAQCNGSLSITAIEVGMYLETLLGSFFYRTHDYEESLQHYSQALAFATTFADLPYITTITHEISKNYEEMNNKLISLDYYKKYYKARQMQTRKLNMDISDYMMETLQIEREEQNILDTRMRTAHLDVHANLDRLTNVNTTIWFQELLAREKANANDNTLPVAILYIDVDWFRAYNDHYGHIKGDNVLSELGFTLRNSIDLSLHSLARVSGDCFAIYLRDINKEDAIITAKQILSNVRKLDIEHRVKKSLNILTVSIGVSSGFAKNAPIMFLQAKKAMEASKRNGKNRVTYTSEKGGV
ncbi:MAG: GGDEF domain-containing protein [Erysipelotrichaceae bacterium]